MFQSDYAAAFITGLFGASHCIAMCGGIACLLGQRASGATAKLAVSIGFNLGRIISYSIAGAIVAGSIQAITSVHRSASILLGLQWLAAIMLILLGIHLTRWWSVLSPVESIGKGLWRKLQPRASRLLTIQHPLTSLPLGMLWGWLPCGLVYSTLTLSASQGSWWAGAGVMFSFGLGTFSVMLTTVLLGQQLSHVMTKRWLQVSSGIVVLGLGMFQVVTLL